MDQHACIKPYELKHREAIRRISVLTALAGEPADQLIDGFDLLADALTKYFTDFEPESCFVAEQDGRVVGYIIGAIDTRVMDKLFTNKILGQLIWQAFRTGFFLKAMNLKLVWHGFISFLRGEFATPDLSKDFPATLHINLLPEARGFGNGSALMIQYLSYLSSKQVKGVRMATLSASAGAFFNRHGFSVLFTSRRSYLKHVTGSVLPLFIFGKQLSY